VEWPLASLRPHPLQAVLFSPRAEWQVVELAASMEKNGLQEPIEVLRDRTIIAGHGRAEAAKRLGWTTITCWVRSDLASAGPEAIERRMVESNSHRRQLSMLDVARNYRHLLAITTNRHGRTPSPVIVEGDLRDLIGKRFGISGRTVSRWLKILELPLALQTAVESGQLQLTTGCKIAALDPQDRELIAERIEAGEVPADVAAEYLPAKDGRHLRAGDAWATLARAIRRSHRDLDGREERMPLLFLAEFLPDFRWAHDAIGCLLKEAGGDTVSPSPRGDEEE
jgi:ParB-like chromosome segregation protein Spo0J